MENADIVGAAAALTLSDEDLIINVFLDSLDTEADIVGPSKTSFPIGDTMAEAKEAAMSIHLAEEAIINTFLNALDKEDSSPTEDVISAFLEALAPITNTPNSMCMQLHQELFLHIAEDHTAHAFKPTHAQAFNVRQHVGVADKGVAQLEKSLGAKVEALVSRQLQTQFQTNAKQVLQEGLRSCLEASVIPAFEWACQEKFGQVDAAFEKGILEYKTRAQQQWTTSHNTLVTSLQEALSSASSLATFMKADGQLKLLSMDENAVSERTTKPMNGALPEKAMTVECVEEVLDPTKVLSRLISERTLKEAFNKALSLADHMANNLSMEASYLNPKLLSLVSTSKSSLNNAMAAFSMLIFFQHIVIFLYLEAFSLEVIWQQTTTQLCTTTSPSKRSFINGVMLSFRLRGRINGSVQARESIAAKQKNFKGRAKTNAEMQIFFIVKSTIDPG